MEGAEDDPDDRARSAEDWAGGRAATRRSFWILTFGGCTPTVCLVYGLAFGLGVTRLSTRVGIIATMLYILVLRSWAFLLVHESHWSGLSQIAWIAFVLAHTAGGLAIALAGRPLLPDFLGSPPRR